MSINFKDFPTFSPTHYKSLMDYISPVQEMNKYLFKRDDLFTLSGISGGKVRQGLRLVHDHLEEIKSDYNSGIISGCGLPSPQGVIVSVVAKYFGLKSIITSPRYTDDKHDFNRINVSLSQKFGSDIYGVKNPNPSGYQKDLKVLKEEYGYFEIKFGMNGNEVIDTNSYQVQNIPDNLENLVCISGSGLNLLSILKGLVRYKKDVKNVYGVVLSKFFNENKKKFYDILPEDQKYKGNLKVVKSEYSYQRLLNVDIDWLDKTYEAKGYSFMKENLEPSEKTLFWVIGTRDYDLKHIEKINWRTSQYEKSLNEIRNKKSKTNNVPSLHQIKSNITFGEIQEMTFEEVSDWIDNLRNEIVERWDNGYPPILGKTKSQIIKDFKKLKDYPIEKFIFEDENYPHIKGFIRNYTKFPVNLFFPSIYETELSNQPSIKQMFYRKDLSQRFKRSMMRNVRLDGMYSWSKYLKNDTSENDIDFFKRWKTNINKDIGWFLESTDIPKSVGSKGKVYLPMSKTKSLKIKGILDDYSFRNVLDYDLDEKTGYNVRFYKKSEKIIPKILQVFRIGMSSSPAVNFPVLTSRWIYEEFLNGGENIVWDSSSGWGSRLLGSLCSNKNIHYVGCDPNSRNLGCYEKLGQLYQKEVGTDNTFEIYYTGSETLHDNETFKKYKGNLDLVFTSPPYFNKELYSRDEEQSVLRFTDYQSWLDGFLKRTIETSFEYLKPKSFLILNVADVRMGANDFDYLPLEQDTITLGIQTGFKYKGQYQMTMSRMVGNDLSSVKNKWFNQTENKIAKTEPILIFQKE